MNSTVTGRHIITSCLIAALTILAISFVRLIWLAAHGQPVHVAALGVAAMTGAVFGAVTYLRRTAPRQGGVLKN